MRRKILSGANVTSTTTQNNKTRKESTMKTKILCLFLSALFIFTLAACGDTPAETTPADTTPSGTEKSGEFVVTGEKYAYKNKDVLLLNVDNQTDKDYDVTAVVDYFDADGNKLRSQKKTFTGWASGYQNYFLFQPNIEFYSYTYTVDLKECLSQCYAKDITATFVGLSESLSVVDELALKKDFTEYAHIFARFKLESKNTDILKVSGQWIVFDKNGDIYSIDNYKGSILGENYTAQALYYELTTEKLVWPDQLTSDVTAIFVVASIQIP